MAKKSTSAAKAPKPDLDTAGLKSSKRKLSDVLEASASSEDVDGTARKRAKKEAKGSAKAKAEDAEKEEEEPREKAEKALKKQARKETAKKAQKERKMEKRKAKMEEAKLEEGKAEAKEENTDAKEETQDTERPDTSKNDRFICFIGNLPYTATSDDMLSHFGSLKPTKVRLLTKRDEPSKSRGVAFLEFDNYSSMKTCLSKFHHSLFNDGKSGARKINVELTAGGGGKSKARKDKIKQKNVKLNQERARRMQADEEAKKKKQSGKKPAQPEPEAQEPQNYVHPSRRAHVPGRRT